MMVGTGTHLRMPRPDGRAASRPESGVPASTGLLMFYQAGEHPWTRREESIRKCGTTSRVMLCPHLRCQEKLLERIAQQGMVIQPDRDEAKQWKPHELIGRYKDTTYFQPSCSANSPSRFFHKKAPNPPVTFACGLRLTPNGVSRAACFLSSRPTVMNT
jgi:hypothetical protein